MLPRYLAGLLFGPFTLNFNFPFAPPLPTLMGAQKEALADSAGAARAFPWWLRVAEDSRHVWTVSCGSMSQRQWVTLCITLQGSIPPDRDIQEKEGAPVLWREMPGLRWQLRSSFL